MVTCRLLMLVIIHQSLLLVILYMFNIQLVNNLYNGQRKQGTKSFHRLVFHLMRTENFIHESGCMAELLRAENVK